MATLETIGGGAGPQIFVGVESGLTVVAPGTPLTRLNYYDGKFLRAEDLDVEQAYFRSLTWLSNVAGGSGVVYGFDVEEGSGDTISLSPGLAIDPSGHVLLLPQSATFDVQTLIDDTERLRTLILARRGIGKGEFADCIAESVSTAPPPTTTVVEGGAFYLVTIAPADALCGEDYVYGTLCEEACATSVQRPRRLDGIAVRAWPFTPRAPLPGSGAVTLTPVHLRSRLASARFADETADFASLLAGADLRSTVWCHGACAPGPNDVPLAVLARSGAATLFVDEWTARRELMETPPRRYWAGRMGMRPLAVFLAQVLQFQCQLRDILPSAAPLPRFVLSEAAATSMLRATDVAELSAAIARVPLHPIGLRPASTRVLIDGGIVELPSGGYLPVELGSTVNEQVRRLLGEGVDLTFCVVRPDYIPHALEEAQHMDRISLLTGLDDPAAKQDVEIFVPDGEIVRSAPKIAGTGWDGHVQLVPTLDPAALRTAAFVERAAVLAPAAAGFAIHGAGRSEAGAAGGGSFHFAGTTEAKRFTKLGDLARGLTSLAAEHPTDFHLLTDVARAHANESPPPPPDEAVVSRLAAVGTDAARFATELRVAAAGDQPAPAAFAPDVQPRTSVVGLWATMSCDRDPFSLRPGEVTAVQLTVEIAVTGTSAAVLSYEARGDFRADRMPPVMGAGRRVDGLLSGIGISKTHISGHDASHAGAFDRRVTVVLADPPNAPPSLDVAIAPPSRDAVGWDVNVTWDGSPLVAKAIVELSLGDRTETIPLGTFMQNPDVLVTGNQTNTLARAGLDIIGAALKDPSFAESAEALLFPPPVEPASELTVKPHRNWVLFRRPRVKQCAPDLVPVPVPARHYDVFELAVGAAADVAPVRNALWANDDAVVRRYAPRFVDRIEFAGGGATLNTTAAQVRADWKAAQPAAVIQYAAIADAGAGDGGLVARSRLVTLEQALAAVTPVDPEALAEAVPAVPASLTRPGADGAILVVTRPAEVQTTCMLVIRMDENVGQFDPTEEQADQIINAVLGTAIMAFVPPWHLLGKAIFDVGSTQVTAASASALATAWTKVGTQKPDPKTVFVFSQEGDDAAEPALLHDRAVQVVEALGGQTPATTIRTTTKPLPGGCPSVVFVFRQG
jgi:hypothetical protein